MNEHFEYKPYGKSELAMLYIKRPVSTRAALNWLKLEIESNKVLQERLLALGYHSGQRIITIAQLRAITEEIGEP
ncbi:MAG: DUF4248 domain-containing protein [Bacteroidales bacterium]|nr:DUF4248 domain-containing protein [Bacteroidales bacterium]